MSAVPSNRVQIKNDRILKALKCEKVDRTPIWMMRQAGRYLPEYRQLRTVAKDFMSLCQNPQWAMEVTLQPLERFELDAAIIFSDILTIPDAMGLGLYFEAGEGPKFHKPLETLADIEKLQKVGANELSYVMDAISLTSKTLAGKVPLIGFCGSPWTIACYMIEGGSSKAYTKIKKLMYNNPEHLHHVLECLSLSLIDYMKGQILAGANVAMVFDTWGGVLSPECYEIFSLSYMQKITSALKAFNLETFGDENAIPIILFTKNGGAWLDKMANTGCHALGVDWTTNLKDARARVQSKVALQGNLDPSILYASHSVIEKEVKKVLDSFGHGEGHVFNLGHGIHPDVPYENVDFFIKCVHKLSPEYHRS